MRGDSHETICFAVLQLSVVVVGYPPPLSGDRQTGKLCQGDEALNGAELQQLSGIVDGLVHRSEDRRVRCSNLF